MVHFRYQFAQWLAAKGQVQPDATAAVLAAALDGILLHRALGPDLPSSAVREVLGRLLVRAESPTRRSGKMQEGTKKQ